MFGSRWITAAVGMALASLSLAADYKLTIIHTNDLHARVEPVVISRQEYGGYARLATAIQEELGAAENALLLDAGDVFQGTLYFNVYGGLADAAIMNYIGYSAMAVGNHEFDRGAPTLAKFAQQLQFPLLSANLDVAGDLDLKDLIRPSVVTEVGGERIGIIGATTPDLPSISAMPETVIMKDWVESVNKEAEALTARGINKIILLSHSAYEVDVANGPKLRHVDVIVGGHSHTPLGEFENPLPGTRQPEGKYPTELKDVDGNPLLVVQAWEWGKMLGRLEVTFDENGVVKSHAGTPRLIDSTVAEDPIVATMVQAFRVPIEEMMTKPIATAEEAIPQGASRSGESAMGNFIADAMLHATKVNGVVAAFMNGGGVRAGYEAGNVTFGTAITVQPFANTLAVVDVTGAELKSMLEHGVATFPEGSGALLHPSANFRYVVDVTRPAGDRVVEATLDGQALDMSKTYRICLNSFTAGGGDAHANLKTRTGSYYYDTGLIDVDASVEYIKSLGGTVKPVMDGRITVRR